jgi:cytidine deaminase
MLPNPFGPYDLLDEKNPLLLDKKNNKLSLPNSNTNSNAKFADLINSALKAANNSHAPYSGSPSGVALMDCEGKIYSGWYMESAAYNPSLGPVQAAVVAYVAGGGGGYEKIVAAVLVEKGGAVVKQEDTARLLLKFISPNCEVKVFHCDYSNGCV